METGAGLGTQQFFIVCRVKLPLKMSVHGEFLIAVVSTHLHTGPTHSHGEMTRLTIYTASV